MAKDLDQLISDKATPVLVVALIAGSSFLLGSHYQRRSTADAVKATPPASTEQAPSDSVVSDIEQSLVAPANTPSPDSGASTAIPKTSSAPAPTGKININTASQAQLETITGIGPTKARAIIDYRNQNGPFLRIEELDKVKGIGPATIEKIRGEITV